MSRNQQETHLNRARASLRQAISWYGNFRKPGHLSSNPQLAGLVKPELESLTSTLNKLDNNVICIAAFGLVSRGKSAVINALFGQKVLQTGPLHGVTQYPRSIRWQPGGKVQVELIDTPGLDEIAGEVRAQMARDIAHQADLILFVVSGDITRTEYKALSELRQAQKPLILVFNKIDLYPDTDQADIYNNLQQLGAVILQEKPLQPDEIVMVAAEPTPLEVRVEYPDGTVNYEWETPPPQIEQLKETILKILNREGRSLLALNALVQAKTAEESIASKSVDLREAQAEDLIWRFARYKALAVGLNPIAFLDVVGGTLTDLALIRALAKLYGLPMTGYQAGKILKTILFSSGGLLLSELASSFMLGLGKSATAIASGENPMHLTAFAGTAITQGGIAGYGAYVVGKAAQLYLEKGCSWGQLGVSTVITEILSEVDSNTILYRLQQELSNKKRNI
ncbi:GTP-binding protein [Mastigocoleus testarum]|uniref:GTPase n=1 Tax=Mastigocoleus testarum BC008 TaxID=371196 RepID=A0A0V7ZTS4_9CYAN|nr:GTP-binding protein [Mastigocoleus testarum]KST64464.1 GTPase [Mastigocoleus testarum BC008]KST67793.1 GTPase [Mastigocoleus testarum BC008]